MEWNIEQTVSFKAWFVVQSEDVRVAILAHLMALAVEGPQLGRPDCDTLKGSRLSNLKELRVQVGGDPYRVLFAFDSERAAVLLVGGNKGGDKRWYTVNIPIAERLFEAWETRLRQRRATAKATRTTTTEVTPSPFTGIDDALSISGDPMRKSSFIARQMARLPAARRAEVDELAQQIIDTSRLTRLREEMGLTQTQMAELLSVKQASISQIENRSDPRLSTLRRYVRALGGCLEVRVKVPKHADVVLTAAAST